MNDAFTTKIYNLYPNNEESCLQLMGYLAENLHEKNCLQSLQANEKAFKVYADSLLAKSKTENNDFKIYFWEYVVEKWKNSNGYALPFVTGGLTGAFIFGPWGAAGGVVVGVVGEAVVEKFYNKNNHISQDLKDAYAFLEISPDANNEEVDKAYRDKSRIYHPDKAGAADAQSQLNLCVQLIRNSRSNKANFEAFEVISN